MSQYKLYSDGDGHDYLIPYGIWQMFCDRVSAYESEDDFDGLCDYLSNFQTLEGRSYVIFLEEDLEKNYK